MILKHDVADAGIYPRLLATLLILLIRNSRTRNSGLAFVLIKALGTVQNFDFREFIISDRRAYACTYGLVTFSTPDRPDFFKTFII